MSGSRQGRRNLSGNDIAGDGATSRSPSKTATIQPHWYSSTLRQARLWWPELTASVFSLACMGAVIGVLVKLDGSDLDTWSMPWSIKPNTFISILVTASRIAALTALAGGISQLKWVYFEQRPHRVADFEVFDDASRGPWGSLMLIFGVRGRAIVASMGALVTILALAMEPFVQQVLSYETRPIASRNQTATIANAQTIDYNSGSLTYDQIQYSTKSVTFPMIQGIASTNHSVQFSCPTANCKWSPYQSLAMCLTCRDDANEIIKENCTRLPDMPPGVDPATNGCLCVYKAPNWKFGLSTAYFFNYTSTLLSSWVMDTNLTDYPIAEIGGIRTPDTLLNVSTFGVECKLPMPVQKTDCKLYWCAREYGNTSVIDGVLHDVATSAVPLRNTGLLCSWTQCSFEWPFPGQTSEGPLHSLYVKAIDPYAPIEQIEPDFPWRPGQELPDKYFFIAGQTSVTMQADIRSLFMTNYTTNIVYGAEIAKMLYAADANYSKTLESLTNSITKWIREGPNSTALEGIAYRQTTFIKVRWPWFTYPASLTLLSVVFLIFAMIFASEKNHIVWKSSATAVLFHGLDGWTADELQETDVRAMKTLAEDMHAELRKNNEDGVLKLSRS